MINISNTKEEYVYKKEVDWSLFNWGLTLPVDNQVVFGTIMNRFLKRGESKDITIYLDGKSYKARIINVNFDKRFNRKKDTLQIRYGKEFAQVLQTYFSKSYQYITNIHNLKKQNNDRSQIVLPDEYKEYLAIYTTEYDDSYVFDTIVADDIYELKAIMSGKQERVMESRKTYVSSSTNKPMKLFYEDANADKYTSQVIAPIVMQGDPIGAVIFISKEPNVIMGELEVKLAETAGGFLSKQMES